MIRLNEMMDVDLLEARIRDGYVKVQRHPDDPALHILNYTDKATYERAWDEVTLQCRGLIVRQMAGEYYDAVVWARPWNKFFNLNEPDAAGFRDDDYVYVLDKVDGSLGICYLAPDGKWAIATRGSFTSEQAQHATKVLRTRYRDWHPGYGDVTFLFEIVYPENRIVLDYGEFDDLVLLGAVHRDSGTPRVYTAAHMVWNGPKARLLTYTTFRDACLLPQRMNAEGLVLIDPQTRRMVKVKQSDYIEKHRMVFGLTERRLWERLVNGDLPDDIMRDIPEELHPWADRVLQRLLQGYCHLQTQFENDLMRVHEGLPEGYTRRDFAIRVQSTCEIPGAVFALKDGKDISKTIWDLLRPDHVPFTYEEAA